MYCTNLKLQNNKKLNYFNIQKPLKISVAFLLEKELFVNRENEEFRTKD